jgi:hypothetical protein
MPIELRNLVGTCHRSSTDDSEGCDHPSDSSELKMGANRGQIPYTGTITLYHGGQSPTGFLSHHSTHRMKPSFITSSLVSVLSLMVFCTACSTTPKTSLDDSPQQQMNSAEFEGLTSNTLPVGAKMINEQTLILGSGDSWVFPRSVPQARMEFAEHRAGTKQHVGLHQREPQRHGFDHRRQCGHLWQSRLDRDTQSHSFQALMAAWSWA